MTMLQLLLLFIWSGQAFCFGVLPYSGPRSESGRWAPANCDGTTTYCQEPSGVGTALRSSSSDDESLTSLVERLVQQRVAVVEEKFEKKLKQETDARILVEDNLKQETDARILVEEKLEQETTARIRDNAARLLETTALFEEIKGIRGVFSPLIVQLLLETCVYVSLGEFCLYDDKYGFSEIAFWILDRLLEKERNAVRQIGRENKCAAIVKTAQKKQGDSLPGWARSLTGVVLRVLYALTLFVETVDAEALQRWPPERDSVAHDGNGLGGFFPKLREILKKWAKDPNFTFRSVVDEVAVLSTWEPVLAKLSNDSFFSVPSVIDDKCKRMALVKQALTQLRNSIEAKLGQDGANDMLERAEYVENRLEEWLTRANSSQHGVNLGGGEGN